MHTAAEAPRRSDRHLRRMATGPSVLLAAGIAALTGGCATTKEETAVATMREAVAATRSGDLERGAALARQAQVERPGFVDALFLLAAISEKQGNRDVARDAYRSVLKSDPTATAAAVALAQTLVADSRFDEAESWLLKAIEEDPGAEAAAFNLGSLAERRGAPNEAASWFILSSVLDRRDPRSPTHVARIRLAQGRIDDALTAAEVAVARDPTYVPAQDVLRAAQAPR
ncbi:MAG: tetratricopeptide repeat protein [Planctomycetes bacterium]|nr:tetratricopeptide repeat protein [Planctomycetota bacterium]